MAGVCFGVAAAERQQVDAAGLALGLGIRSAAPPIARRVEIGLDSPGTFPPSRSEHLPTSILLNPLAAAQHVPVSLTAPSRAMPNCPP